MYCMLNCMSVFFCHILHKAVRCCLLQCHVFLTMCCVMSYYVLLIELLGVCGVYEFLVVMYSLPYCHVLLAELSCVAVAIIMCCSLRCHRSFVMLSYVAFWLVMCLLCVVYWHVLLLWNCYVLLVEHVACYVVMCCLQTNHVFILCCLLPCVTWVVMQEFLLSCVTLAQLCCLLSYPESPHKHTRTHQEKQGAAHIMGTSRGSHQVVT